MDGLRVHLKKKIWSKFGFELFENVVDLDLNTAGFGFGDFRFWEGMDLNVWVDLDWKL